ncbi:MAG: outer membrane protein assembly factor BamE [Gammaproteobacteria bacterium]|nr:outer membrane protein assembly factor BamE [Gammaproteobacteria bacterium]
MKLLRLFLILITTTLCGCAYHQVFEQGNILTPAKMETVKVGMSSQEVVSLLGSPILENIYADNRLAYIYTQQPTRNKTVITRFIITFQNNHVVDMKTDLPKN